MIGQNHTQINPEIPATIYQQAEANGLGRSLAIYKPLFPSIPAILGLIAGLNALYGIFLYWLFTVEYTIITNWYVMSILSIICGISLLALCDLRVYLFSNGLIRATRKRVELIRWDQVRWIVQIRRRSRYTLGWEKPIVIIQCNNGASFRFEPSPVLKDLDHLRENIRRGILQQRMPETITSYNNGDMIPFGRLAVSKQGIADGQELLSWNDLRNIEISDSDGVIIIKKVGRPSPWTVINLSQIPNLLVFIELVKHARTGQQSYQA